MAKKEEIKTGSGKIVRIPKGGSRNREIEVPMPLLQEVCYDITKDITGSGKEAILIHSYDFGEKIGYNDCLEITQNDPIISARPIGEKHEVLWTPKMPEPTSIVTVVLIKTQDEYLLLDAYFGTKRCNFWWKCTDEEERQESILFYKTHAWCANTEKMVLAK